MSDLAPVRQQLEAALQTLKAECAALQIQLDYKRKRMDALEFLLTEERIAGTVPVLHASSDIAGEESTTERAREIVKTAGSHGVKPRDITKKLNSQGLNVGSQFASNVLWRLKNKTKEVIEFSGRYYWKGFEPTPLNNGTSGMVP